MTIIIKKDVIKRSDVINSPDTLFVFGDNDIRRGYGGLAKEVRGEPNSLGIRVKKYPSYNLNAYYSDEEFDLQKQKIDEDLDKLIRILPRYKHIAFPMSPIGSGLADLHVKSPKTYAYLNARLTELGLSIE